MPGYAYNAREAVPTGSPWTLTVASSTPDSGVTITVDPADLDALSNGTTPFTRRYDDMTIVTLLAPAAAPNGNGFVKWQRNGVDCGTNLLANVGMDADATMTAVYDPLTPPPPEPPEPPWDPPTWDDPGNDGEWGPADPAVDLDQYNPYLGAYWPMDDVSGRRREIYRGLHLLEIVQAPTTYIPSTFVCRKTRGLDTTLTGGVNETYLRKISSYLRPTQGFLLSMWTFHPGPVGNDGGALYYGADDNSDYNMNMDCGGGTFLFDMKQSNGVNIPQVTAAGGTGAWQHTVICADYIGHVVRAFVNNVPTDSQVYDGTIQTTATSGFAFRFGSAQDAGPAHRGAGLGWDEVGFWNNIPVTGASLVEMVDWLWNVGLGRYLR